MQFRVKRGQDRGGYNWRCIEQNVSNKSRSSIEGPSGGFFGLEGTLYTTGISYISWHLRHRHAHQNGNLNLDCEWFSEE